MLCPFVVNRTDQMVKANCYRQHQKINLIAVNSMKAIEMQVELCDCLESTCCTTVEDSLGDFSSHFSL